MIPTSQEFRKELFEGNRNYVISAYLYTTSGSFLVTNAEVWERTLFFEDAVSQDDMFDVGTAVINKFTMGLNNIEEQFSGINFKGAIVVPSVGLVLNNPVTTEMLQKGIYIVDDCQYDGTIIKLKCLDLMELFDRKYDTELTYPATLLDIVADACNRCGIVLNGARLPSAPESFVNSDYVVSEKPTKNNLTYREVISWCAQIAGGFARVNRLGALEIKWFDIDGLDDLNEGLDGGVFDGGKSPYTIPSEYLNTTDGMEVIFEGVRHDEDCVEVEGVDWFVINGESATKLYVCGNSWISPTYSSGSTSFPTGAPVVWGYNTRDALLMSLYRQEFTVNGKRVLKIRWDGFSTYTQTSDNYKQIWELFLIEGGLSVINAVKKPTISNNGTYAVKVGSTRKNYSVDEGRTINFDSTGLIATVAYESGDTADGGSFMSGGDTYDGGTFIGSKNIDYITQCFTTDVAVDATEIAGVQVIYSVTEENETKVRTISDGDMTSYKVTITDNDFISTDAQAMLVCSTVVSHTVGMKFYRAASSHLSDPCIEAGDLGLIRNFRGNYFPIIISRTKFGVSVAQTTNSNAETESKNTSYRDSMSFNFDTSGLNVTFPTDLLVITGFDGEDYAIYIDIDTGNLITQKVPKRIYYFVEPKLEYFPGETVDVSEAVVHAVYNDLTEIDVTSQCTFSPAQGATIEGGVTAFTIVATWVFTPGQVLS